MKRSAWIGLVVCVACSGPAPETREGTPKRDVVTAPSRVEAVVAPAMAPPSASAAVMGKAPEQTAPLKPAQLSAATKTASSALALKRLVVTTGVKDREPLAGAAALPSDGSAIYAFAELANPNGESENVRITFERKGGAERVGNVVLPVPANVPRHRTWAMTHFIRAAGVWEAVLWSESGAELGRTSFEVAAS